MAANPTTLMTAIQRRVAGLQRLVTLRRAFGMAGICLLACLWLAGIGTFAQNKTPDKAPAKAPDSAQAKAADKLPDKIANSDCLDCHSDPNTTRVVNGKTESLIFPTAAFAKSVHSMLSCTDCHTGVK